MTNVSFLRFILSTIKYSVANVSLQNSLINQFVLLFSGLTISLTLNAQAPQGSDILLAGLSLENNTLVVSAVQNVTNRPGYDNQPHFLPDGNRFLFTSSNALGPKSQTEIMLYNLLNRQLINLTTSRESEYSPTLMPTGDAYSIIRVDKDGKQKLWAYSVLSDKKWELLKDIEPVGYHAWVNQSDVVLFVLGEPHRFELANLDSGKSEVIDTDIGASLFKIPNTSTMSYSRNATKDNAQEPHWQLMKFDPKDKSTSVLTDLPKGAYYYAWSPDGKVIAAQGSKLLHWNSKTQGASDKWTVFADMSAQCPNGITRIAVNSQQTRIALVCTLLKSAP